MNETEIKQLKQRIWYLPHSHETDRPILAVICGDNHTLMMDAGNSSMHSQLFLNELPKVGINKPDFLVLTHGHWDHILGYSSLNVPAFSHKETKVYLEKLQELEWDNASLDDQVEKGITTAACAEYIKKEFGDDRQNIKVKTPTFTYCNEMQLDLGNITCTVKHVGGDHASDSSILYIEEEKILFIGDSISPCIHSANRYYRIEVISALLDELEKYDADYVVHSHAAPMNRDEFQREVQEYRDVIGAVKEFGDNLERITKTIVLKWNRELPKGDIDFIQYFINGLKNEERII